MNIGICGLLPDQVRWVQQEFPQHSLRFLDKDAESQASTFAKGCDKVVLMTKFIGHHLQDRVPPSKRVLVTGGTTKLRSVLNTMPTPVRMTTPPPAPKAAAVVQAGDVDYSPMLNANVGDTVTIIRPKSCTLKAFEWRLANARTRAKKIHGIVTTVPKSVDGGMQLTIKAKSTTLPKEDAPPAVATSATDQQDSAVPSTPQETTQMQIAIETARPIAVVPVLTQARESAFWQSVFVETMKQWPGAPIDTIAARADEALRAYNARTGMTVSAH